jgi:hypothetical protein
MKGDQPRGGHSIAFATSPKVDLRSCAAAPFQPAHRCVANYGRWIDFSAGRSRRGAWSIGQRSRVGPQRVIATTASGDHLSLEMISCVQRSELEHLLLRGQGLRATAFSSALSAASLWGADGRSSRPVDSREHSRSRPSKLVRTGSARRQMSISPERRSATRAARQVAPSIRTVPPHCRGPSHASRCPQSCRRAARGVFPGGSSGYPSPVGDALNRRPSPPPSTEPCVRRSRR